VSLVPTNKMGRRSAGYVIFSGLNVRLCELFDAGNVWSNRKLCKKKQPYLPKSMFTSLANKVVLSTLCHSGGIKFTTLVVTGTNYMYVNSTIILSRPWQPSKNPNAITNSKPQCLFELLKCNQLLTLLND
jgi:hypothetical protein